MPRASRVSAMPFANVRGIELYYEAHGDGAAPAVVVAHGALGSVAHAEAVGLRAEALARAGFRVIAYDARGHGRSGFTTRPEDYRPASLAEDLLGLLDTLELPKVGICGTSMGASTAVVLANAHPERVDRLVLRSFPPFEPDIEAARSRLYPLASLYRWLGETITTSLVTALSPASERTRLRALLRGQRRAAVVPVIRGFLAAPLERDALANIDAPTLVLGHPGDRLHPLRSAELVREMLPRCRLFVAPSGAHWETERDELVRVVAAGLRGEAITAAT